MKIIKKLLCICLLFSAFIFHVKAEEVIEIYTKEDLNNIRNDVYAEYKLMNDIIFDETDFDENGDYYNDGKGWQPIYNFYGVLDGNGYSIVGLTMKDHNYQYIGFINRNSGTIKNLRFEDVNYDVTYTTYWASNLVISDAIGIITGYNSGTIDNCSTSGILDANLEGVAGIAGYNTGNIRNSYNEARIHGESTVFEIYVAGITAYNSNRIYNCFNEGEITSLAPQHFQWVGGIVGENEGTVEKCHNSGEMTSDDYLAGIVSINHRNVVNCYNEGNLNGELYVGGIVSYNYGGTIDKCYNSGTITTILQGAAGISCRNYEGGNIRNCYNMGLIHGKGPGNTNCYAGGIVADQGKGTVENCYNVGQIKLDYSGALCYGGTLFAYVYGGTVRNCYALQDTHPTYDAYRSDATISNLYVLSFDNMKKQSSFTTFDFNNTWEMNSNFIFPSLKTIELTNNNYTISFKPHAKQVKVGQSIQLGVNFSVATPNSRFVWYQSSDESIAKVNREGVVSGVKAGTVTITALSANNKTMSTTITVKNSSSSDPLLYLSGKTNVYQGQTFTITLNANYNPGISNYSVSLLYDNDVFEVRGMNDSIRWGDFSHTNFENQGKVVLTWKNNSVNTSNGTIFTLKLQVKKDAKVDTTSIQITDHFDNSTFFYTQDIQIKVNEFIYGDVDSDGNLSARDRMLVSRYLAHWDGYDQNNMNFLSADVNADGKINTLDRVILARCIAGWGGYTILPYQQ